ncbi:ABC transporter substrate-binding protein [Roseiarcaceae bacterium H3SJ34-1]|uniref:ABC transporter substrate-binding protein n=1 Tax=Terripilifer ovatus TaxID=3032367 RepID=UPI003AB958A5|nr:ABC transporter substrate-binding protein [Roseiarcaceae bacterium H3SJ34-1]
MVISAATILGRSISRRVVASTLVCAAPLALVSSVSLAQQAPPLKIGVILPLSGNFTPAGEDALTGLRIYFDQINNEVAGRKIQLIVEDEQGRPDVALTKARKLVEGDKVQILTGFVSSAVALAVNDYAREKKIPMVVSADGGANELTTPGPLSNPYLVRTSQNGRTPSAAAAEFVFKQGWRKVAAITSDYAGGFDTIGGFAQAFCKLGGSITQEQYPPLTTNDYGPYVTNIKRDADAVVTFLPGANGLKFANQFIELGVKDKMPLMDIFGQIAYEPYLTQLGANGVGIYSVLHYTPMIKTPENERFVKEYVARAKRLPSDNGPDAWVGAKAIAEAAKAVGGKVEDTEKFLAAFKALKFDSPKGPIAFDKFGQVIHSMYIRKVEKVGNDYVNTPIQTFNNVDQFWPFSLEEFESYKYRYVDLKGSMTDCKKVLEKK